MKASEKNSKIAFSVLGTIILIAAGYGGYRYYRLYGDHLLRGERIAALETSISALSAELQETQGEKTMLAEALENEQGRNTTLSETLKAEQDKNAFFETQIKDLTGAVGKISGTVGVLDKLSKTDPELLQKYSKVYFLSENYLPTELAVINSRYLYNENEPEQIHIGVAPFLSDMQTRAEENKVTLKVVSAYRSFVEQAVIKDSYKVLYGSGANQFSADQGYSEHQLGTAIDFTSSDVEELSLDFETSEEYAWLLQNAHRFGFILSYPKENMYYQFEPWHWRFVGVALATRLHDEGVYFYNLAQREIDKYLVRIFD